jgi:hexosaminidase
VRPLQLLARARRALVPLVLAPPAAAAQPASPSTAAPAIAVIPRPDSVVMGSGAFLLHSPTRIVVGSPNRRLLEIARQLAEWLRRPSGFRVTVREGTPRHGDIALELSRAAGDGPEAYALDVTPSGIRVAAPAPDGVLWGVQTLRQLLPPAFDDTASARAASWPIPAVQIRDAPRFAWRGALLDASRHFFPTSFVKRFVDLLSRYKLNVLHWHLTDDQGWRVQVSKWPRLTSVGAWRTEPDGLRYGGYYSRRDIRTVVEYARQRGVTVVPEIEMPGHSVAAIAAYPWLSCTGQAIPVATTWGVHNDILCPRERTFAFLEDVLRQVVALFPSRYVHVGGDEVPKDQWRACADCQAVMRAGHLPDEDALQGWFLGRIGRWLDARGRRLVGWDEITSAPLPAGAVVEVWRDTATIAAVAHAGHDVVAAPKSYTYLDHSPGSLTLEHVYAFDPVPAGLTPPEAAHVLGGEAPIWSERITTTNFDLMAFPRLLAFAEVVWTSGPRDFADFHHRLTDGEEPRLAALGVGIGPEDRDVLRVTPAYDSTADRVRILVATGVPGITVRCSTDGRPPSALSPACDSTTAFAPPDIVRLQGFFGDRPIGDPSSFTMVRSLARGRPYRLLTPPSPQYPGTGPRTLTDGATGSTDFHDGFWQGWQGSDLEAVVDLGRPTPIAAVEGAFLQATPSWILLPRAFTVWLSDDGENWRNAGAVVADQPPDRTDTFQDALRVATPAGTVARWVMVRATGSGPLPPWHGSAGQPSWIFCDEIIVR